MVLDGIEEVMVGLHIVVVSRVMVVHLLVLPPVFSLMVEVLAALVIQFHVDPQLPVVLLMFLQEVKHADRI
jgi:hypothetical protein